MIYPLYLGIDAGGTGSRARLEDAAGTHLASAEAGPGNLRLGLEAAQATLVALAKAALGTAGLNPEALHELRVGAGCAGAAQPARRAAFLAWAHPFEALVVATDAHVACLGAFSGRPGGVIILGTGSCGHVITKVRAVQVGGHGFPISDQASGAWLGLEAVRRAVLALDGLGERGACADAVLAAVGGDADSAVAWQDRALPRDYAGLAPLVFHHAEAGDPGAQALVAEGAEYVGRLAAVLQDRGAEEVALAGGLAERYRRHLVGGLKDRLRAPEADGIAGALVMVRRATRAD